MAKCPPSFQFYPSDWILGTDLLSLEARGGYISLLCHSWIKVDLPFDEEKLAPLLGVSVEEFRAIWEDISDKFTIDDQGFLRNERLESVRELALTRSAAGRKGGSKGAPSKRKANGNQSALSVLKTEDRRLKSNILKEELSNYSSLVEILEEWIDYKIERREDYTDRGFQQFLTRIKKLTGRFGEDMVTDALQKSMASNYAGWEFHLDKPPSTVKQDPRGTFSAAEQFYNSRKQTDQKRLPNG